MNLNLVLLGNICFGEWLSLLSLVHALGKNTNYNYGFTSLTHYMYSRLDICLPLLLPSTICMFPLLHKTTTTTSEQATYTLKIASGSKP